MSKTLKVHDKDNVLVALENIKKGTPLTDTDNKLITQEDISAKHKIALKEFAVDDQVIMYGVLVGKAVQAIPKGGAITTFNVKHAASEYKLGQRRTDWQSPSLGDLDGATFMGFQRSNGKVGTANYWLVLPMVFCENRNLDMIKEALVKNLGYAPKDKYGDQANQLLALYRAGKTTEEIMNWEFAEQEAGELSERVFPNVDGVKFLRHDMGCGGTRQDAQALCGLLAGYIAHPNVAGATVLSLGCQHAQFKILEEELEKRGGANKPVHLLEQQVLGTEEKVVSEAIRLTFAGLIEANKAERVAVPISKLVLGLECGGSDGFSGISANPAVGYASDLLVAAGGTTILSEFPELCGVEQELSDRCVDEQTATKFVSLMRAYEKSAEAVGSGFDMNPSPGNIKDGLITDAIKSAGAAKKGGTSPIHDVLDYPEMVKKNGLNLLNTPGNDVESTTGLAGAGANVIVFTTGLGTPTGNPIVPVIKIASNSILAERMADIIDVNTGTIIDGKESIEQVGHKILKTVIEVASGQQIAKAVQNHQNDFIPWKRGVSL
ncbi:altronate dehydratase family protein [Marinilongibacter aquaticus]|uniref:UxaA family hydrolase n=1 Tax=Marinilongibacter aquaticus TaxID=2975157 RepID=UPI0021BD71EB|nr:altronate dehydratase family protein [Marinilongibacter aquaticus]UBM58149.1 altronate dehydratase family protein [Marinilongibacter aquaticus]